MKEDQRSKEEVFPPKIDKDSFLLDSPNIATVSGNIDYMDSVRTICLGCGHINGSHYPDCNERF